MTGAKKNSLNKKQRIDWLSVALFGLLMAIGWMNIYAAVFDEAGITAFGLNTRYGSQLIWMGICVVVAFVIMLIDDVYYHVLAYPAYVAMILVLIVTIFVGTEVNGARSWFRFGAFSVQPIEFAKFTTALALARYMSSHTYSMSNWKNLLVTGAIIFLPLLITVFQNDVGSGIIFFAFLIVLFREGLNPWLYVAIGMLVFLFVFSFILTPTALLASVIVICALLDGILNGRWKNNAVYLAGVAFSSVILFVVLNFIFRTGLDYYWCLIITSILSLVLVGLYAFRERLTKTWICLAMFVGSLMFIGITDYVFDNVLQLHQQKRILNLLGVENDPRTWGYNVNQSKIAIGSGGFFGKGYLQGTQTKYDFVPEQSTDFIFCTVGEEWGFLGAAVVVGLFCWLIVRLIIMGERQKETFGRVYCYSVASIFLMHVMINIGMTVGIMPVIGIPLPLFSYGGSSLLAFTILFFVAVKLDAHRREAGEA